MNISQKWKMENDVSNVMGRQTKTSYSRKETQNEYINQLVT